METARLSSLMTISAVTLVLASCATIGNDDCFCVTRHASGGQGAPLDTWVNFGIPESGAPEGFADQVAVAELTFLSIRGTGIQVNVCNQHRQRILTSGEPGAELHDVGPELFAVPPGCTIQIRCPAFEPGVSGGCEADYRFRWLD